MEFAEFDASYVERLRAEDRATQEHFVRYFSELIRLKLRSRLNSADAIADVRQETFARVFVVLRKPDGLRQAERLGAFVNSVCNHVLLEHYRSHKKNVTDIGEESETIFVDTRPGPLDALQSMDAVRSVRQSLAKMPDRDRHLLQAVLMEEGDKDAICKEMGVSREYLRVLVHRAKQSFKSFHASQIT